MGTGHDLAAFIGTSNGAGDALARALSRQRMQERQTAYDDRRAVADVSDQRENWRRGRASSVFP
jgi:hypothetical protein